MDRCGEPEGGLEDEANWEQSSSVPGAGGVLPALGILRPRILHPVVTPCLPFILLYKAISSPPLVGESGSAPGSTSLAGKPLAAWMRSSVLSSPLVSSSVSTTSSFSCHPPRSFQLCCGDLPLLLCSFPLALALQSLYCLRQSSPAPSWGGGVCGPRNPCGECLSGDACLLFVRPGSRRINGGVFERAPIHCSDMTENPRSPGVIMDLSRSGALSFLHHHRTDQHLSRTLSVPPPPPPASSCVP